MANRTSQHILTTAANLPGFCLFVITSFHVTNRSRGSIIDDFTFGVAFLLSLSCMFSFASLKTHDVKKEVALENIADNIFMFSLFGILLILLLITLNIIE